jgi:hypothetical protein
MGVIDVYFVDNIVKVLLSTKCNRLRLNHLFTNWFFIIGFNFSLFFCRFLCIRCATALPMGVAPEAIAEFFRV